MTDDIDQPVKKRKIRRTDASENIKDTLTKKLHESVAAYNLNKGLYNQHYAQMQLAQVHAIEAMRALGKERSEEVTIDDLPYKVTIIAPEKAELDEAALRAKVGEDVWAQITKCAVDKSLLDKAVKAGVIDMEVLTSCVSTRPTNPYIKVERAKK